jgi:Gpi18-like mannosyltransferase
LTWAKIEAWYAKIPYSLKVAVLIALTAKLVVFSIGFASAFSLAITHGSSTNPFSLLLNMFSQWDSSNYISIAQNGYVNSGNAANFIVFFPLYSVLIRLITFNFDYANFSGLLISNLASIVAVIYLFKLAKLDYNDGVAKKAVLFLCVFPTAYFMSAVYTEGLFLALVIASLYYARTANWPLAGFLGFLASLTRIAGLILLPTLVIEYFYQKNWKVKASDFKLAWLALPAFGFLIYLGINYQVTGSFFTFLTIEREHWFQTFDPLLGFNRALNWHIGHTFPDSFTVGYAEIIFAAFGYLMIGLAYKFKIRPSYQVYMLLIWMLAVATGFWVSVPRYVLAMFPLFLVLALASTKKPVTIAILAVSCAGLFFFTWLFASGAWAF